MTELDPDLRKRVLRQFTYGLYAVSAVHEDERGIFTANWLTQVSFDPPLIAVSIERDSSTLPIILASRRVAISTLAEGDRELAGALGRPKVRAGDKLALLGDEIVTVGGIPVPARALGAAVCTVRSVTEAGDSRLVLGEVIELHAIREGEPLTMRAAGFRHAG